MNKIKLRKSVKWSKLLITTSCKLHLQPCTNTPVCYFQVYFHVFDYWMVALQDGSHPEAGLAIFDLNSKI